MKIEFKDNSPQVVETLHSKVEIALEACGIKAEEYAKKICPVDTGRLKTSISHAVGKNEFAAYIGTNVTYARSVEYGTEKQKAQPYLRPAAADHSEQYKRIFKNTMKGD